VLCDTWHQFASTLVNKPAAVMKVDFLQWKALLPPPGKPGKRPVPVEIQILLPNTFRDGTPSETPFKPRWSGKIKLSTMTEHPPETRPAVRHAVWIPPVPSQASPGHAQGPSGSPPCSQSETAPKCHKKRNAPTPLKTDISDVCTRRLRRPGPFLAFVKTDGQLSQMDGHPKRAFKRPFLRRGPFHFYRESTRRLVNGCRMMTLGWRTGTKPLSITITERRMRYAGHVLRMTSDRHAKTSIFWKQEDKRKRGRPKLTWRRTLQKDLESKGISLKDAESLAKDRAEWRRLAAQCALHGRN
ncbi:hypothetical protein Bbelb_269770, partial [Branchiostoma belcheri]